MNHIFQALIAGGMTLTLWACSSSGPAGGNLNVAAIRNACVSSMSGWRAGKLPPENWPKAVRVLRPLRIYSDRVNTVIVLSEEHGIERGIYVYVPISSHLPQNGDGWQFEPIGEDIWRYTRTLGEQNADGNHN